MSALVFRDRVEAGELLAEALVRHADEQGVLVLALPRGGVPVAAEIARRLKAPLDVLVVRKLGVPGQEELAMGAITSGDVQVMHDAVVRAFAISPETIGKVVATEEKELRRRELAYRGHSGTPQVSGKKVILVDDGIATGSTLRAAVKALRQQRPQTIIVAVPVSSRDAAATLRSEADEFVALSVPDDFNSVGEWYQDFAQTSDEEVKSLLESSVRPN